MNLFRKSYSKKPSFFSSTTTTMSTTATTPPMTKAKKINNDNDETEKHDNQIHRPNMMRAPSWCSFRSTTSVSTNYNMEEHPMEASEVSMKSINMSTSMVEDLSMSESLCEGLLEMNPITVTAAIARKQGSREPCSVRRRNRDRLLRIQSQSNTKPGRNKIDKNLKVRFAPDRCNIVHEATPLPPPPVVHHRGDPCDNLNIMDMFHDVNGYYDDDLVDVLWYRSDEIARFKHTARMQTHLVVRRERVQKLAAANTSAKQQQRKKKNNNNDDSNSTPALPLFWNEMLRTAFGTLNHAETTLDDAKIIIKKANAADNNGNITSIEPGLVGLERWTSWFAAARAHTNKALHEDIGRIQMEFKKNKTIHTIVNNNINNDSELLAKKLRQVSRQHSRGARLFAIYTGRMLVEVEKKKRP